MQAAPSDSRSADEAAPEERAHSLAHGLRRTAEQVRYRRELLEALVAEEQRLGGEIGVLEDTLRSLQREAPPGDAPGGLREDHERLGFVAVRAYIAKRKEVARLRAHIGEIARTLDALEPALARRQAEYAAFRRSAGGQSPAAAQDVRSFPRLSFSRG